MIVLPAIDIRDGRNVRLINGDYGREIAYTATPADTARSYREAGAEWIHVVDLDAAKTGELTNLEVVREVCAAFGEGVEVGGGVRSREAALRLLDAGASRVVMGTVLVRDPALAESLFRELGERVVAGIDAKDGRVAAEGWIEGLEIEAEDLVRRMTEARARRFIVTDIARDGALTGPNLHFLRRMAESTEAPVIASGGVGTLADIEAVAGLRTLEGLIVGRAIHDGRMTPAEAIAAGRSPRSLGAMG